MKEVTLSNTVREQIKFIQQFFSANDFLDLISNLETLSKLEYATIQRQLENAPIKPLDVEDYESIRTNRYQIELQSVYEGYIYNYKRDGKVYKSQYKKKTDKELKNYVDQLYKSDG